MTDHSSGDRIVANLQHAAAAVYAKRRYVLSDADYAAVQARRAKREPWKAIAADYGMSHTTLAQRIAEAQHVARQAAKQQEKPQ